MSDKSGSKRSKENNSNIYFNIFAGSLTGTVIFFVFIALFSFIALKSALISETFYVFTGLFSAALSSMIGGYLTVRPVKKNGIVSGALAGFAQAVLSSVTVYFINERIVGAGILIHAAVFVIGGALGGLLAVNLKVRKKY